ncbi:hypothetical protein DDB_G0280355 [Dictyostelium discoideum AX4]|uniref:Putative uncharacterized protein DDB_G0280355 n=1 Tax=Dictyostelium discoideum TaxID=44689 RepID=Y6537_DICDI|nr:hypothetical protein DDB_G0280355 [Dictyostelium discoideum AX4]Q54VF9.1 RecName: Full=Putative uncharacterized protein DDB_G0280355 [Dictyostelium discoideum]EAL67404.1 hypothetical protein DDB_G0280355 [Dictyostelium discoideum AX4]|eukprot:XP_641396.1 hypothetical protein DDB_G0280355 [Dictyostelium discoideum AX4]
MSFNKTTLFLLFKKIKINITPTTLFIIFFTYSYYYCGFLQSFNYIIYKIYLNKNK